MTTRKKLKIAAVADIHVKLSDQGKWINYFQTVSKQADVLLICGDLTDTGQSAEAEVLAEELNACTIPVVVILGNHDYERDEQDKICKVLQKDQFYLLDGSSIIIKEVGFAGVKGLGGGFDQYMMPMFGEPIHKEFVQATVNEALRLDQALVRLDDDGENIKKIVLLHYSPLQATVVGEPEPIFPFLGSSHLAEPLNRRKVTAVFHGHAHKGTLHGKTSDGVAIFNVAKPILLKEGFDPPFFIYEV